MPVKYGDWFKYVLRAEGVDEDSIARHTGLGDARVHELATNAGAPPNPEEIGKIAGALNITKSNMDRSLKAMQVYDDLKTFKNDCGGACCPWNAPID